MSGDDKTTAKPSRTGPRGPALWEIEMAKGGKDRRGVRKPLPPHVVKRILRRSNALLRETPPWQLEKEARARVGEKDVLQQLIDLEAVGDPLVPYLRAAIREAGKEGVMKTEDDEREDT